MTRAYRQDQIKRLRFRLSKLREATPHSRKIEPLVAKLQPLVLAEMKAEIRESSHGR